MRVNASFCTHVQKEYDNAVSECDSHFKDSKFILLRHPRYLQKMGGFSYGKSVDYLVWYTCMKITHAEMVFTDAPPQCKLLNDFNLIESYQ